ncbi:MAG: OmpH family outer membrane protein [Schleiferiaceae bacterium]|jgi:outer membrane protein
MNKLLALSAAALLALGAMSCQSKGSAPVSEGGARIVYVRLDSLVNLYEYHKEMSAKYEDAAKKAEAELVRQQQNLQAEYDVLQRAAPSLSKVELERAQMDFQRVQNSYQMLEQQKGGELQQMELAINETVKEQVDKAIEAMKSEEQIDLVLIYETNVLYGSEALDYTSKLAEYLNKLPKPEPKEADAKAKK